MMLMQRNASSLYFPVDFTDQSSIKQIDTQLETTIVLPKQSQKIDHFSDCIPPVPDHMIVWLDAYIGHPTNNRQLKHYFRTMTAPDMAIPCSFKVTDDSDIDNLIRMPYTFTTDEHRLNEREKKILTMFSNVANCFKFIESLSNTKTTLFVITSGRLGRQLVPQICHYEHVHRIYVFTCNLATQFDWTIDYAQKIVMFDHEWDLLGRLIRDIADYYKQKVVRSKECSQENLYYLKWTKKLFNRTSLADNRTRSLKKLAETESWIRQMEIHLYSEQSSRDDYMLSVECDEG